MNNVFEKYLKNMTPNYNLRGAEADFFDCTFKNKPYIYKRLYSFSNNKLTRFKKLDNLSSNLLVLPTHIVYDNLYRQKGYLLNPLYDYEIIFELLNYDKNYRIKILKAARDSIIEMHKLGIIHCDLHAANIMFKDNDIKIIDFDNCYFKGISPEIGTNDYFGRQYSEIHGFTPSLDIFVFNRTTAAILCNIDSDNLFKTKFFSEENFKISNQKNVWQKTKQKKELTYDDFLINYY